MIINNNYLKIYKTLIRKAKKANRKKGGGVYYESHHIVPKSFGGSDKNHNRVLLTPHEHYKCHELLTQFTSNKHKASMLHAWTLMAGLARSGDTTLSPEELSKNREEYAKKRSLDMTGNKNVMYGKQHTEESKKKMSDSSRGRNNGCIGENHYAYGTKLSEDHLRKMRVGLKGKSKGEKNGMYGKVGPNLGKKFSEKTCKLMSEAWLKREYIKCPHCQVMSKNSSNMQRWHFNNCKLNDSFWEEW